MGPRTLGGVALGLVALAGLAALVATRADSSEQPSPPALPLPARRDDCDPPDSARVRRARAREAAASAKIARYPFAPAEGRRALQLLLEAESCFELAGRPQAAAATAQRARGLGARLQRDYRDHWIRYRGAHSAGRPEQALHAIQFLLELLEGERGPFVQRLQRLQQELATHSPQDMP